MCACRYTIYSKRKSLNRNEKSEKKRREDLLKKDLVTHSFPHSNFTVIKAFKVTEFLNKKSCCPPFIQFGFQFHFPVSSLNSNSAVSQTRQDKTDKTDRTVTIIITGFFDK